MKLNSKSNFVSIKAMTVVKIIMIFILFYFMFMVKEILAILFISLIFASAVDPWVDWMQGKKIPRGVGIIFIYFLMFASVFSVILLIIPPITEQVNELIANFPEIFEKVASGFSIAKDYSIKYGIVDEIEKSFGTISSTAKGAIEGVFSTVTGVVGGIFSFFLVLVITFYMVVEENAMKKIIWSIAPKKNQVYVMQLVNRMQRKIGLWLRGQLILSLVIFCLIYVVLSILGVKYALVLALIAGLTEFVPYLGPILAAIPAIFLALTQSPVLAVVVAIMYYIVQLVENNIIVPKIMQKVVGLNPIVSIAVLLIGFKVAGIPGAILSIPVATAVSVVLLDLVDGRVGGKENFN